jgi:hypothetical protein
LPTYSWTRAFGPSPIRVQEARAGSPTARSTLIWEIPDEIIDMLEDKKGQDAETADVKKILKELKRKK